MTEIKNKTASWFYPIINFFTVNQEKEPEAVTVATILIKQAVNCLEIASELQKTSLGITFAENQYKVANELVKQADECLIYESYSLKLKKLKENIKSIEEISSKKLTQFSQQEKKFLPSTVPTGQKEFNIISGLTNLWKENFTSSNVSSKEELNQKVKQHQQQSNSIIQNMNSCK